jgi:hypothetical protein
MPTYAGMTGGMAGMTIVVVRHDRLWVRHDGLEGMTYIRRYDGSRCGMTMGDGFGIKPMGGA